MKIHCTLLIFLAAVLSVVAQEANPSNPVIAPATLASTVPTPLPAGYDLLEALNDLLTYEKGTPLPLNRALDWFQQAALAKGNATAIPEVSGLRQPSHASAVWSGILFRAVADGVADDKAVASRVSALDSVLPKDAAPKLIEAINAAAKSVVEKKPAEVTAFLQAASAAFPEAGRVALLSVEKNALNQLVKEHGYASLGFILDPSVLPNASAVAAVPTATDYNSFGFDLLRALRSKEQYAAKNDANIIFSPVGIATIMESLWMGAKGQTASELATALHLQKDAAIPDVRSPQAVAMQLPLGKNASGGTLLMSNDFWLKEDWKPTVAYEKALTTRLGAGIHSFDRADLAVKMINDHVSKNTNGMIQEVLSAKDFGPTSRFVLTNVVYFKAPWEAKFDATRSEVGDFLLASGTKAKVTYMNAEMEAAYCESGGTQFLSLPFAGGAQRLVLMLPAEGVANLARLESELNQNSMNTALTNLKMTKVAVSIPRFNLNGGVSLKDMLPYLNVKSIFAESTADLSVMSDKSALYISAFRHQAAMEVNEDGAEASAASAAVGSVRSINMPTEFTANRPFVVTLLDNSSNTILFLCRVGKPTSPSIPGAKATSSKKMESKRKK